MNPNQKKVSPRRYFAHPQSKLVRVDEQVFEELHALAGKLQMREGRRVSVNGALHSLLFSKNERSFLEKAIEQDAKTAEKTSEKASEKTGGTLTEFHSGTNLKKGVFASKKGVKNARSSRKNEVRVARGAVDAADFEVVELAPMKRFSLKNKKFVAE
jgi:hypothetical protein